MHGFEYALAGLMISEGMVKEGLSIVTAVRDRYRGHNRNPFNEIECGSNYARSMAAFALLPIYSGFSFDMPKQRIGFAPVLPGDFRAPWFLDAAWGEVELHSGSVTLTVFDGVLPLREFSLPGTGSVISVTADGKSIPFTFADGVLFVDVAVRERLKIERASSAGQAARSFHGGE